MLHFLSCIPRWSAAVSAGLLVACQATAPVRPSASKPAVTGDSSSTVSQASSGTVTAERRDTTQTKPLLKTAPVQSFPNYCELEIQADTYLGSCKDGKPHGRGILVTLGKGRFFFRAYKFENGNGYSSLWLTFGKKPRVLDLPGEAKVEGVSRLVTELKPHGLAALANRAYYIAVRKAIRPDGFPVGLSALEWADLPSLPIMPFIEQIQRTYSEDDYDGVVGMAKERLAAIRLNAYRNDWLLATSGVADVQVDALRKFAKIYQGFDPDNRVIEVPGRIKELEYNAYRNWFDTARTTSDWAGFISRYQANDPDNLVPKAKAKLAQRQQELEQERQAKARAEVERAKRLCAKLYVGQSVNFVGDVFGVSIVPYTGLVTGFSLKQNSISVRVTSDGDLYGNSLQIGCERLRD